MIFWGCLSTVWNWTDKDTLVFKGVLADGSTEFSGELKIKKSTSIGDLIETIQKEIDKAKKEQISTRRPALIFKKPTQALMRRQSVSHSLVDKRVPSPNSTSVSAFKPTEAVEKDNSRPRSESSDPVQSPMKPSPHREPTPKSATSPTAI